MAREEILKKIDDKFQDKYTLLRLGSFMVKEDIKMVDISFYFVEPFFEENKKEIENYLLSILPNTYSYKITFINNYYDSTIIFDYIKKYLAKNHPFLYTSITDDTIYVFENNGSYSVELHFNSDAYSSFVGKQNSVQNLIEALFERFPTKFKIDVYNDGEVDHSLDEKRLQLKRNKSFEHIKDVKSRVIAVEATEELVGKLIEALPNYISDIVQPNPNVCVCGTIDNLKEKIAKSGQKFKTFTLNDNTGSINAVAFESKNNANHRVGFSKLDNGMSIVVAGSINNDKFGKGLQLICNRYSRCYIPVEFKPERKPSKPAPFYYQNIKPQKYVELSQTNFFTSDKELDSQYLNKTFVCFDLETTGLEATDSIIDIGAYKIINGIITESFNTFINPRRPIPSDVVDLTGIRDEDVKDAPTIDDVIGDFCKFTEGCTLVGHNVSFDIGYIRRAGKNHEYYFYNDLMDTLAISNEKLPNLYNHKLNTVCKELNVTLENHHRASDDALACAKIFLKLLKI